MFKESQENNLKLVGLDNQMVELDQDFENMLKAREIARKKLEQKFQDVYNRIKDNKDFMIASGQDINKKLKAYQEEFNTNLESTRDQLNTQLETEKNIIEEILVSTDTRMTNLEEAIAEEKRERKRDWEQQLKEIDDNFNAVKQGFADETKNRISKKKN